MVVDLSALRPWYWRSLPLKARTGSLIFNLLFRREPNQIATLLESPYPPSINNPQVNTRYSICAGAPRSVNQHLQLWTPPVGEILPLLTRLLQRPTEDLKQDEPQSYLPFTGGYLGWLGYDLAWEIERLPYLKTDSLPFPVAFWYEPESFAVLDHVQQILWLATSKVGDLDVLESRLEENKSQVGKSGGGASPAPRKSQVKGGGENKSQVGKSGGGASPAPRKLQVKGGGEVDPRFLTSQAEYEGCVRQAQEYIRAGDIFQANLSLRFAVETAASGWEVYLALQQINPSPFSSYWQTPWGSVISCSPERLVQLQKRQVTTRPIAGTRHLGLNSAQQLMQELLTNPKERAEHIMLVDLERNDLGRVCEWGSVTVDELLTIERYSHVMHLVSNIIGTLRLECNGIDLIRAVFPGGTISGCPKVRCLEIIEELEPLRRSLFYGSCGYLDWRGYLDLNILIRTLLLTPTAVSSKIVWGQVGAGIVADSDPKKEWDESLSKAQAQLAALKKLEAQ